MSKTVIGILIGAVLLLVGMAVSLPKHEETRIGQQHESEGQQHLSSVDQKHVAYKTDPPTSGPHYTQPAAWGTRSEEHTSELQSH